MGLPERSRAAGVGPAIATTLASAALVLAFAGTLRVPGLGFTLWGYNAAFAASLATTVAAWPWLKRRRVATLAMAISGTVAVATGFVMLYSKDLPHKEAVTWWHSWTSFALFLAFLVHGLHNNARIVQFTRRLATADRGAGAVAAGAWTAALAFGAWTGVDGVRDRFTTVNYLYLASWAIFLSVAFAYGAWLLYRLPAMRARLRATEHRNRVRALVDTSLFAARWAAFLTGVALLYFADFLRGGDFKYVSKWWHTATSVAFLALHVGFNARLLAAHARRVDEELQRSRRPGNRNDEIRL